MVTGGDIDRMLSLRSRSKTGAGALARLPRIIREHPTLRPILEECENESGTQVLFDVKLRAPGRQSDDQAADRIQAKNQRAEADPRRGRLLRAVAQRRPRLLEAQDREIPRREANARACRPTTQMTASANLPWCRPAACTTERHV